MGAASNNAPVAANTEAVVTLLAAGSESVEIEAISFSYSDTPTGGVLTVESPSGTILHHWYITSGGPGPISFSGSCIKGAAGQSLVVRLTAGGAGIYGSVNVIRR